VQIILPWNNVIVSPAVGNLNMPTVHYHLHSSGYITFNIDVTNEETRSDPHSV